MLRADVVVVGAGPAGSTAARSIAEEGYSVLLLEKDRYPGERKACGGMVEQACLKDLVVPGVIEKEVLKLVFHFPGSSYTLPASHASVRREVFDRALADRAAAKGATLLTSSLVWDATRRGDGVAVRWRDRFTREDHGAEGSLIIFADGPNTLAHKFDGIGFKAKPDNTAHSALYEVGWEGNPLDSYEFFFDPKISPWGYGWIFPKRNLLNVGVMCLMGKMRRNIKTYLDSFAETEPEASTRLLGKPKLRFAAALIPLQPARRIYGDQALVVGDAAGMADPIWGGGVRNAMDGALLAAEVAVEALKRGQLHQTFLSQFDARWRRTEVYKRIRRAYWLSKLFQAYSRLGSKAYLRLQELSVLKAVHLGFSENA